MPRRQQKVANGGEALRYRQRTKEMPHNSRRAGRQNDTLGGGWRTNSRHVRLEGGRGAKSVGL